MSKPSDPSNIKRERPIAPWRICHLGGIVSIAFAVLVASCENPSRVVWKAPPASPPAPTPPWAVTNTAGTDFSQFDSVGIDGSDNVYAVGALKNLATYSFGNLPLFTTIDTGGANDSVLVKYNSSGTALWTRIETLGNQGDNQFVAVAVDTAGNSYVAGYSRTSGWPIAWGNGVSFVPSSTYPWELLFMKFDTNGSVQWISTQTGGYISLSRGAAVDSSGNSFQVGDIESTGGFTIGSSAGGSVGVTGINSTDNGTGNNANGFLVKYNTSGVPSWVQTPISGTPVPLATDYFAAAADSSGNIAVAGYLSGAGGGSVDFGGQSAAGGYTTNVGGNANALVVKYDTNGAAQWARTTGAGAPGPSTFSGDCVDSAGDIYAVGWVTGPGTFDFGSGQTFNVTVSGHNAVLVKYNASGTTLWARSSTGGSAASEFAGVAIDKNGNVLVSGQFTGPGNCQFGSQTVSGSVSGTNALMVKYDANGNAMSAATVTSALAPSQFYGVAADSAGHPHAVGFVNGNAPFSFGNNLSVTGPAASLNNALIVKYP